MNPRGRPLLACLALLWAAGAVSLSAATAPRDGRPNILLIVVDDLNDWIGVMGGHPDALTPNIDRLARRGTLFLNAHAAAPLCGPTRAALVSGLRPSTTGLYGHNKLELLQRNEAARRVPLLPRYFAQHGYKTLGVGKILHEGAPAALFEEVAPHPVDYGPRPARRLAYEPPAGQDTSTDWGAYPERDEALCDHATAQWAAAQLAKAHDRPFLLCVGFIRPHVPWHVPQPWFDLHPLERATRPPYLEGDLDDVPATARAFAELPMMPQVEWMKQEQRWERSVQAYLACTTFADHQVGVVLDALGRSAYADRTIVLLVGDNGYQLGEKGLWAKHTLWERSTRVPLIIARPGDPGASSTRRPVNHIDLYPTLVELAGLPPVPQLEGRSLVPLLDDPGAPGYEASVTTYGYGNHSVRTERWRYIRYADGAEELYDHEVDANEWHNLAGQPHVTGVVAALRRHLPTHEAAWIPESRIGLEYNDFLRDLFARTRADR